MAQSGGPTFVVTGNVTPGAISTQLWEIPGVANKEVEIVRLEINFGTVTSSFCAVELATATAAATVWSTSTPTPFASSGSGASSSFAPKLWSAGTSTNGTGYAAKMGWNVNVLAGLLYFPVPEERFTLPAGTGNFLAIKFAVAPPGVAIYTNLVYRELW